jgi:glycosyltransferase involved in cell wall biosynthesis
MNPKKISVLIPAFNEQGYIEACLKPLVAMQQTYTEKNLEIEIIVCDNNSTDNTIEIIKKYSPNVILVTETTKERRLLGSLL